MPIRARSLWILVALLLLSAGLVWSLPGDEVARAMFQSSPPDVQPTDTPTPTPEPIVPTPTFPATNFTTPVVNDTGQEPIATPTVFSPDMGSPTDEMALPQDQGESLATETAEAPTLAAPAGYLAPPTLTAPGAFAEGQGLPQQIGPRAQLPGGQVATSLDPAPVVAQPAQSEAARLIDRFVALLSYGWLCCGSALVGLVAVGFVWLVRRKPSE